MSFEARAQVVTDQMWIDRAEKGDTEAIYMLGYKGIGEKGPNYYYQIAAKKGHSQAMMHVLDDLLFRADENADVLKAKEFADIARKMKVEGQIYRNLDVVDICAKAGKPDFFAQGGMYPGPSFEACDAEKSDPTAFQKCLFEKGNNIDVATIYANGIQVKQDFWKAISYVCHGCSIPAELESMVLTLYKATKTGKLDEPFSFCNHATGTYSTTACFQRKVAADQRRLYDELDSFASSFDEDEKKLYEALRQKAFSFFDLRAASEQDLSGSMRGIFQTEWEFEQRQFFLETLKKLEGHVLKLSKRESAKEQKELDQLYAEVIHSIKIENEKKDAEGMIRFISAEKVEETQAEWVQFQQAFAEFASKRYSKLNQDHFRSWLIDQRIKQLQSLVTSL